MFFVDWVLVGLYYGCMNVSGPQPEGGLLQSTYWADFLRTKSARVVEVSFGGETAYGTVQSLPLVGSYLYIARYDGVVTEDFLRVLRGVASENGCGWVRMDVPSPEALQGVDVGAARLEKAPSNMQPIENFIVPIGGETDLLAGMKSKTRYNVRLAQKKGVEVSVSTAGDEDFSQGLDAFFAMVEATAQRKGVRFHKKAHYAAMFAALPPDVITLYVARYEGEVVAANIMTFYVGVATYLHGATSDNHRNVMAPFLLQYRAMQDAQERGCAFYDFGGYFSETSDIGKEGISRFKKGFSPHTLPHVSGGTWDVVISPVRYRLFLFLRKLRQLVS